MKYKGIIFDLDGVICSTDHYHYLAWKALANRLGVYFDETINNRLRGVSRMASLEIVLERSDKAYSPEEKAAFAEEKIAFFIERARPEETADVLFPPRHIASPLQHDRLRARHRQDQCAEQPRGTRPDDHRMQRRRHARK